MGQATAQLAGAFGRHRQSDAEDRDYRRALGCFATGVTVVTALGPDGRRVGLTVNSFTSVSLDPPLVSWCQAQRAVTRPVFAGATHFAVNVLAADQRQLARHFAAKLDDRFAAVDAVAGLGGAPLLEGVAARFECRTAGGRDVGDHVVHFGEVERYRRFDREPLIFAGGRYGRVVAD
ncbi:MAG: flavin reductase family protein [Pseudomonadota bacterium]